MGDRTLSTKLYLVIRFYSGLQVEKPWPSCSYESPQWHFLYHTVKKKDWKTILFGVENRYGQNEGYLPSKLDKV